jgi:hypothetical protein
MSSESTLTRARSSCSDTHQRVFHIRYSSDACHFFQPLWFAG